MFQDKLVLDQAACYSLESFSQTSDPNAFPSPLFLAVIWRDMNTGALYTSRLRERHLGQFYVEELDHTKLAIPAAHYQPIWDPYITRFDIDVSEADVELHYKTPRLVGYDGTPGIAQKMRHEICIMEQLRRNPHPALCEYFGCAVDSSANLVMGMYMKKYHWTLGTLLLEPNKLECGCDKPRRPTLNYDHIVQRIGAGLHHLHAMGLAHNDISPNNIMIDEHGNPVIIDFDNCCAFGQACRPGTPEFTNYAKFSDARNDMHSFRALVRLLQQKLLTGRPSSQVIPTPRLVSLN